MTQTLRETLIIVSLKVQSHTQNMIVSHISSIVHHQSQFVVIPPATDSFFKTYFMSPRTPRHQSQLCVVASNKYIIMIANDVGT